MTKNKNYFYAARRNLSRLKETAQVNSFGDLPRVPCHGILEALVIPLFMIGIDTKTDKRYSIQYEISTMSQSNLFVFIR